MTDRSKLLALAEEVEPAIVERMLALTRNVAELEFLNGMEHWQEARSILAAIDPIEPDEHAARHIAQTIAATLLGKTSDAFFGFKAPGRINEYLCGETNEAERMIACVFRGIKEGRKLAQQDSQKP